VSVLGFSPVSDLLYPPLTSRSAAPTRSADIAFFSLLRGEQWKREFSLRLVWRFLRLPCGEATLQVLHFRQVKGVTPST